jgi:hypothetical protein
MKRGDALVRVLALIDDETFKALLAVAVSVSAKTKLMQETKNFILSFLLFAALALVRLDYSDCWSVVKSEQLETSG